MSCSRQLSRILPPICQRCGKPESSDAFCPSCWGKQNGIDSIRSVFMFEGVIRKAIHELKYNNLTGISGFLAAYMAGYYQTYRLEGEIVLPVPLHEKRLRTRGYNHSEYIAAELSGRIGIPMDNRILSRIKDAPPQARTLHVRERAENVKDAFFCRSGALRNIKVILVDDVCTSGSTLEACAVALKAAGAKQVTGFTLTREIS